MVMDMEIRKVPIKNYIFLIVLTILTFFLLYYSVSYYQKRKAYESSRNTRMGFLSEVKEIELQTYILENHDTLIYISDSTDEQYRVFEKQLKTLIIGEDLTKELVYMDMYKVSNQFFQNLKQDFFSNNFDLKTLVYPNILTISNGKIISVLYTVEQDKSPRDVIYYIKEQLQEE